MSWLKLDAPRNAAERLVTWLTSQVPILPFIASKSGQFPEGASLRQVVFALLSSAKFAGAKAETDATHIAAISCLVPVEILDLEWQVQRVSPLWCPLLLIFFECLCSDERLGGVACLLDSRVARSRSRS